MTLFRMTAMVALAGVMAAAGIRFWLDRAEEAGIRADLEAVRVLAMDYARHFCETPGALPASPETIARAASRIGESAPGVTAPGRWSIRLGSRTTVHGDHVGINVLVRYRAAADDVANPVLLAQAGASRSSGHIEVPVSRRPTGNRSGFRWLMSDESC